ncbi:MAG: hypothetical protein KAR13_02850 [Desulfobulbaceae bacterium]|nr:hypothetical protein [Desulfobulbaceae bacterium]
MSLTVYIIDTSYLDELFGVPGFSNNRSGKKIKNLYKDAINTGSRLFVPLACIFELANHIAGVPAGDARKELGDKLFKTVKTCVGENMPWDITPTTGIEFLPDLCKVFASHYVSQCIGLTDTSIIQEARRLKDKYSSFHYKVHIWTTDDILKSHEPDNESNPFLG